MRPNLKTCRRLTQMAVALAFVVIPWQQEALGQIARGNLLSLHLAGLPLADPLAALQAMLGSWSLPTDLLMGLGLALGLAALLGPVFCSWACPFGLLSELTQATRSRLWPASPAGSSRVRGFPLKAGLTALLLALVLVLGLPPAINQLSLPGWYSRLFQQWFLQGELTWAWAFLALVLAVEALGGRRLWCRYLCPQSVLLMLAQGLVPGGLRLRFDPKACLCRGEADPCLAACSLGLNPRRPEQGLRLECNNCADCVVTCQGRGRALSLGWGQAGRPPAGP